MFKTLVILLTGLLFFFGSTALGQGSIYGLVTNADLTFPADSHITFFGFLDDTDEELRIETCDGAGYDDTIWYDDFQNYLTEAPDNPYDYYFFNHHNGEGFHLEKMIPHNSYQQENVTLNPVNWPSKPDDLRARSLDTSSILIHWTALPGLTYHLYRRSAGSNGSFFRLDNTAGSLADPGIADSFYIDYDVYPTEGFNYLVIAQDQAGNFSPHSGVVTAYVRIQEITLDSIANAAGPKNELGFEDTIAAGKKVTFYFRAINISGETDCFFNISLNLKVYSPDDAHWSYTLADTVNIGKTEFSSVNLGCFSCDGDGIDTVGLAAQTTSGPGLYEGFNDRAFLVTIKPAPDDIGKQICIDTIVIFDTTAMPMAAFTWRWTGSNSCSVDTVKPAWYAEPLCFHITKVDCCIGFTGNVDCSPNEAPDISDITTLIDHLYLSHKPLCCYEEADVNGSGGGPDISDITLLIDHLYLSHNPLPECP
ncbi:MAG: hypothetical protein PHU88_03805 [candidate division Zixibacteria bacterium]|nr:hypothetical protein [candidate division Zixibacteria bacterium]MDD5424929.1 hypothetical protein [candidate division Zixibacteria bacterium]